MDHEIKFKNKKIWEFYQENKNIDIEKINLMFVDILEMLFQEINPALTSNLASQLLDNMRNMQTQMCTMSETMTKTQLDINTHFTLKFLEFKKESLDDMRSIIANISTNTTEKIAPIIKQYSESLIDKTQILISDIIPKNNDSFSREISGIIKELQANITKDTSSLLNSSITKDTLEKFIGNIEEKFSKSLVDSQSFLNNILSTSETRLDKSITDVRNLTESKFGDIREITNRNNESQAQLHTNISDLLKKLENSSSKGKISENILCNILVKQFPTAEITSVGSTKETGDVIMSRNDKPKILFENKNYNTNVTQDEVRKFLRDIETQNCSGIMMSQHSGIANKNNFEIGIHNGNVLVYLHNLEYNPDIIKVAVDIIDNFKTTIIEKEEQVGESINIDKEILDEINADYSSFLNNKTNHIKSIQDMSKKLVAQVEDIKLPALELYLSKKYSTEIISQEKCPICERLFKKGKSFNTHKRACEKKLEVTPTIVINTMS